jgi:hypothetical protein
MQNRPDKISNDFLNFKIIELKQNSEIVANEHTVGHWSMAKIVDIIYNPQLHFKFDSNSSHAIITRMLVNSMDNTQKKFILYFNNGLEISLEKKY